MSISTHVLDTTKGRPAVGIGIELKRNESDVWKTLNATYTDADGRVKLLLPEGEEMTPGIYRIQFATGLWYRSQQLQGLYPVIEITFTVEPGQQHYHIPLLLTANGYTTYRGS